MRRRRDIAAGHDTTAAFVPLLCRVAIPPALAGAFFFDALGGLGPFCRCGYKERGQKFNAGHFSGQGLCVRRRPHQQTSPYLCDGRTDGRRTDGRTMAKAPSSRRTTHIHTLGVQVDGQLMVILDGLSRVQYMMRHCSVFPLIPLLLFGGLYPV